MSLYEEYEAQTMSASSQSCHTDSHVDEWIDEGHLPGGHSGHADSHVDENVD